MIQFAPKLFRGPRPGSFDELARAGIRYIVNLEPSPEEEMHEMLEASRLGLQILHFPYCPVVPPEGAMVDLVLGALKNPMLLPIYVHCRAGVDRTGYVVAAYRATVAGIPVDDAIAEMKQAGMHWWYYWWIPSLRRFIAASPVGGTGP